MREQVAGLQAQLDILTVRFDEANAEKSSAVAAVDKGQAKLELANRLTSALADENVRWAAGIVTLDAEKELLVGELQHILTLTVLDLMQLVTNRIEFQRVYSDCGVITAGDVLLASAFISYIGPFTKRYRDELISAF